MDINIVKTIDGIHYNLFGEIIYECKLCGNGTTMGGTRLCDRCYEISNAVQYDMPLVEKAIKLYKNGEL